MAKSTVGENALDRTIRLLGRFNERFSDPDVPGMEEIVLEVHRDGLINVVNADGLTLFAGCPENATKFLEASVARQVQEMREKV